MHQQSVKLDLPVELYERIRETAEENNMPVEAMLLESIALMFGSLPDDSMLSPSDLEDFTDEHLWAIVHRRFALPLDMRLRELTALGKHGNLSNQEQEELEQLVSAADRYIVLRSKALLLLKQRGFDVERRLELGA
jgi:hypothetical protein